MIKQLVHWLVAIALAGCSAEAESPKANRKQERREAAEAAARKPPVRRTYNIDGNELVVVDVPSVNGDFVDVQKCFIWRDTEFKTASMQCPSDTPVDIPATESTTANPAY